MCPSLHSALISQRYLATQLLGSVISQLFPQAILCGGDVNSLGFYYDFILEQPMDEHLLELIEVHLLRLVKEGCPLRFMSMMRENAQALFEHHHHPLLAKLAGEGSSNILELIQIHDFYGLCPALGFVSSQDAGHLKLLKIEEFIQEIENEEVRITRIIGTSQASARDLKSFLKSHALFLKKKDHRSMGPKLNLFSFNESMGELGVLWHSKGLQLRSFLQNLLDKQLPEDVKQISSPIALKQSFLGPAPRALEPFLFEGQEYCLRSSPLRQHLEFLRNSRLQLEDLPCRVMEHAAIYHHYPESQRWGLLCSDTYLTDYMTACCSKQQVMDELISSLHFIEQIITIFSFEAHWTLIASKQKSSKARQEQTIDWLRLAIQTAPRSYPFSSVLEEEEEGDGPRLELRIRDALRREWPVSRLSVIQQRPELKSLLVQESNGQSEWVILTRQVWCSLDRFIALLVEHYEGQFPLWLAPEQVRVIAIGEANRIYAKQVSHSLRRKGLRVGLDLRQAKLSARVHEAERENIPYLVLLGEQERIKQKISLRVGGRPNQSRSLDLEAFLNKVYEESLCPMPIAERAES